MRIFFRRERFAFPVGLAGYARIMMQSESVNELRKASHSVNIVVPFHVVTWPNCLE